MFFLKPSFQIFGRTRFLTLQGLSVTLMGCSIFLAGAETNTLIRDLVDNGAPNILLSYYRIHHRKMEADIDRWMSQYPEANWFLDSGAFSYAHNVQARGKVFDAAAYVAEYFAFIDEYGDRFCRVTECDFDIGGTEIEEVDEYREEMLHRWPHLNVTPVWHTERGEWAWQEYIRDPRIKALAMGSGDILQNEGATRRRLNHAFDEGKPVHGFGLTRINTALKYLPFDSVDSSAWLMGQKLGSTYVFRANKFRKIPSEKKLQGRRRYASYFRNIGCDVGALLADNPDEVRKANLRAWLGVTDRFEALKQSGDRAALDNAIRTPIIKRRWRK